MIEAGPNNAWAMVMLAPGHSGSADDGRLISLMQLLHAVGVKTCRFNFRDVAQRLKGGDFAHWPDDTLAAQQLHYKLKVVQLRRQARMARQQLPLVIGGFSRGGLIATQIADHTAAAGSFALGFPFHPPGNTGEWRSHHLHLASKPVLLINGTNDPYGSPEEVAALQLPTPVRMHWLQGRDHGLNRSAESPHTTEDSMQEVANLLHGFLREISSQASTGPAIGEVRHGECRGAEGLNLVSTR